MKKQCVGHCSGFQPHATAGNCIVKDMALMNRTLILAMTVLLAILGRNFSHDDMMD